jgi:hypothetical protein
MSPATFRPPDGPQKIANEGGEETAVIVRKQSAMDGTKGRFPRLLITALLLIGVAVAPASSQETPATVTNPRGKERGGLLPSRAGSVRRRNRRVPVVIPSVAAPIAVGADISTSDKPLLATASVLGRSDEDLVLGLPDGGIAISDGNSEKGTVVRLPAPKGAVRAVAADRDTVWWVAGSDDVVYEFRRKERRLLSFAAGAAALPDAAPWIGRLSPWKNGVVLLGAGPSAGEVRILDGASGRLQEPAEILPADVAAALNGATALLASDPARSAATLATMRTDAEGTHIAVFSGRMDGAGWRARGTLTAGSDLASGAVHLTPYGIAWLEGQGRSMSAMQAWTLLGDDALAAYGAATFGDGGIVDVSIRPDRISLGGSGVWTTDGRRLIHHLSGSDTAFVYLPWNGGTLKILDLLADRDGIWLATDKGVRRIVPGKPDAAKGYDGYARVRLGPAEVAPTTDRDQRLADEVTGWMGVPYLYGGNDKKGVDCSGFVGAVCRVCGVNLPRTSGDIANAGRKVVDELRYGDILCYPGHVALYVGNGKTAEAKGTRTEPGTVTNATIWTRTPTTVRRVLP